MQYKKVASCLLIWFQVILFRGQKKDSIYFSCDTENVDGSKIYVLCRYYNESKIRVGANGTILLADGTRKEISFRGVGASSHGGNVDLTTIEYVNIEIGLPSASTAASSIDNIMVCDEENLPFEPYTGGKPSPSPEYPQEIVSAGEKGSIGVEITGKNLFGGKAFADKIVELGGTLQESDKTVHISANNIRNKEVFVFPDNSKQYTLIFNGKNTVSGTFVNMYVGYADGTRTNLNFVDNKKLILTTYKDKKIINLMGMWQDGEVSFYYDKCGIFEGVLTETDFKPYEYQSLPIATPTGLPAIPVPSGTSGITYTDANGQAWIADEIDFSRGKYIQRVWQAEFDGSEDEKWKGDNINYIHIECLPVAMRDREGFCSQYIVGNNIRGIRIGNGNVSLIIFDDFSDENALSNFKANLSANPLKVMTYLDTPIERDLAPEEIEAYQSLVTYDGTTVVENDAECYTKITYMAKGN